MEVYRIDLVTEYRKIMVSQVIHDLAVGELQTILREGIQGLDDATENACVYREGMADVEERLYRSSTPDTTEIDASAEGLDEELRDLRQKLAVARFRHLFRTTWPLMPEWEKRGILESLQKIVKSYEKLQHAQITGLAGRRRRPKGKPSR